MLPLRRALYIISLLFLCNCAFLAQALSVPLPVGIAAIVLSAFALLGAVISPPKIRKLPRPLAQLNGGCELLLTTALAVLLQALLAVSFLVRGIPPFPPLTWMVGLLCCLLLPGIGMFGATIRLFFSSGQITARHRLFLLALWWIPLVNLFACLSVYRAARRELKFRLMQFERNEARKEAQVCATKYPLLLVHGIFFRDWKQFNYWGRIPKELEENGAKIFYGQQQSSSSVEQCAQELRDSILSIVEAEQCEKVNIIAHSKGGLDARYAISCLGMDAQVASLTTVCTPHRGCRFARNALDQLPEGLVAFISRQYDLLFSKLGDDHPDFFSGVRDLSDEACAALNEQMPDCPGVYYQSVGTKMARASSATFPLNLSYSIISPLDGDNDGLVSTASMPWGEAHTQANPKGGRGISHGDMIDLTRKDIPGFDVCEFYVKLVEQLKSKGL